MLVIDCQSELISHLESRFVVPLIVREHAPPPARRLNPIFKVGGQDHVMVTQSAAAVAMRQLGPVITSLADQSFDIIDALDVLISGV